MLFTPEPPFNPDFHELGFESPVSVSELEDEGAEAELDRGTGLSVTLFEVEGGGIKEGGLEDAREETAVNDTPGRLARRKAEGEVVEEDLMSF